MKYSREITVDGGDSLSRIAALVAADSEVLDLGVGNGSLGRFLARELNCEVDGADLSEQSLQEAAADYRELHQVDLEQADALQCFGDQRYDAIVMADVLEHLRNPGQLLLQAGNFLKPDGRLLLSIPNVAYAGVALELLEGRFDYREEGILDDTHVRFYTLQSIRELVRDAGFAIDSLDAVELPLHRSEFGGAVPERIPAALRQALAERGDSLAYQYVLSLHQDAGQEDAPDPEVDFEAVQGQFEARLLWMSPGDLNHGEDKQLARLLNIGEQECGTEFDIIDDSGVELLRYVPADREGVLTIHRLELENLESGQHFDLLDPAVCNLPENVRQGLVMNLEDGRLALQLADEHAWFEIRLEAVSAWETTGRLRLHIGQSWPRSQDYTPPDHELRLALEDNKRLGNQLVEERAHRRGLMGEVMALKQRIEELDSKAPDSHSSPTFPPAGLMRTALQLVRKAVALLWLGRRKLRLIALTEVECDSEAELYRSANINGHLLFAMPPAYRGQAIYFEISATPDHDLQGPTLFSVIDGEVEKLNAPLYVHRKSGVLFGTLLLPENLEGLVFAPSRLPCEFKLNYIRITHIPAWARWFLEPHWHWLWFYRLYGAGRTWEQVREELAMAVEGFPRLGKHREYPDWWHKHGKASPALLETQRSRPLTEAPLISIILPVYNTPLDLLAKTIDSVLAQTHGNWQLCVADDASEQTSLRLLLQRYEQLDERIRVIYREDNGHISAASNSALELAEGDYVCFLDHDDLLAPNALYEVAKALVDNPSARVLYTDEDIVDEQDRHIRPHFKPDWNPDYLLSVNYFCHLLVAERELVARVGGLREGLEGAQDYDLILRLVRELEPGQIYHLPRVLYHWRAHEGSTALDMESKDYALEAGRRALQDHLAALSLDASVELSELGSAYRVRYPVPDPAPRVAIIIPTRNAAVLLGHCIGSVLEGTDYPNYELVIVDNQSDETATLELLSGLEERENATVIPYDEAFNFAAMMNLAVSGVDADVILLMNNDMEVIHPDWLTEMVSHAMREDIGAVGAKLLFPTGHLQHCGVVLGLGPDAVAGHAFKGLHKYDIGHMSRLRLIQDYSAVTGACLAIRKSLYLEVGGMDEDNLAIAFNDVDLCLKLQAAGYRNLWTPYAQLYHFESVSRGYDVAPEKRLRFEEECRFMREKWAPVLDDDPAYNPNLTQRFENFDAAWPPRGRAQAGNIS
jgi:methionine biosynthesis protein MetW